MPWGGRGRARRSHAPAEPSQASHYFEVAWSGGENEICSSFVFIVVHFFQKTGFHCFLMFFVCVSILLHIPTRSSYILAHE